MSRAEYQFLAVGYRAEKEVSLFVFQDVAPGMAASSVERKRTEWAICP